MILYNIIYIIFLVLLKFNTIINLFHIQSLNHFSCNLLGARKEFPPELGAYIKRVRSFVDKPLAIGFGVSSPDMFRQAAALGDGVVVGSEFIKQMEKADPSTRGEAAEKLARSFVEAGVQTNNAGAADAVHIHREGSWSPGTQAW